MDNLERADLYEQAAVSMQDGKWPGLNALPAEWNCGDMGKAWDDSVDGAHSIYVNHFFPRWIVHDMDNNSKSMGWCVILVSEGGSYVTSGHGWKEAKRKPQKSLGRAWLIALLFAKAEELRGEPNAVRRTNELTETVEQLFGGFAKH